MFFYFEQKFSLKEYLIKGGRSDSKIVTLAEGIENLNKPKY
jgi:hypothetical protein